MNNLLITGANGFVGSYFIKKYKTVYNIKKFSFLNDDFNTLSCNNIDTILHLSALVHQMDGASLEEYENVNIFQTISLAKKAKESNVEHFIFMSTVKVYGEENDTSYNEKSICNPTDNYGKSKLKAENELLKLEDKNFKITIIRTPIVYGYGVKANIKNLIKLVDSLPFLPLGNIENYRSMIYIGNLAYMIHQIILQNKNGLFLACDDCSLSTTTLIELISKGLGKKVILFKVPFFESLIKLLKPSFHKRLFCSLLVDNSTTKKTLNLKNPYTMEDGISFMINGEKF